ncbi:MAG TPA: biotin/lipoyl-binding protein [Pseudonocardiaceae bacterium]
MRIVRASGAGVLVALALVSCTSTSVPAPKTARVERASVTTGVSGTGSLVAVTEQNLGFAKGGQLTKVMVKVGDTVTAGQVLATVDDFAVRQTLAQQQAQLSAQQAALNRIVNGTTVPGARNTLAQDRQILTATQNQVDAVLAADDSAIGRAYSQLNFDRSARDTAANQLNNGQASCAISGATPTSGHRKATATATPAPADPFGSGSMITTPVAAAPNPACSQVASLQMAATAADRQVEGDKTAVDAAQQKRNVDAAAGQVSIQNARQGVVAAQNTLDSASSDRPFTIDQQSALVASAQAAVRLAQQDVDNTVLRAPAAGTVSAINGAVGEFIAPSSGITALAPGSLAAIPGVTSALATAAAVAAVTRPGGSQFLVLNNVNEFQVVLPFEESDAVKVAPNQKVNLTFDAIPDLVRAGRVLSVAPSATAISSVLNYYVTIALFETDPRLKAGLSTHASVVTNEAANVLSVPNAAVQKRGDQASVTVIGPDGEQQPTPFQAGLTGTDRTEVLAGLRDGQEILVGR